MKENLDSAKGIGESTSKSDLHDFLGQSGTRIVILLSITLLVVAITAWQMLLKIEEITRRDLSYDLTTVLNATSEGMNNWIGDCLTHVKMWASSPELLQLVQDQLEVPRTPENLLANPALARMRAIIRPSFQGHGFIGFFIISPDYINIGSMRDANMGWINLLVNQGDFLLKVFKGEPGFALPRRSDVPLRSASGELAENQPTMFVAAPVKNNSGEVIAVLTLRLDPTNRFTQLAQIANSRESGETYAFNESGQILTSSRFVTQLRSLGLIGPKEIEILTLEIRDPGGNLTKGFKPSIPRNEQPLTFMAQHAIAGKSGINLDGYRDYRGVPVIGVWNWNEKWGFGLTTEIDHFEAYQSFDNTKMIILFVLAMTVLLFLLFIAMIFKHQKQALILAQKAVLAKEYTTAVVNTVLDGIISVDERGVIESFNPAAERIFGFLASEVIGQNVEMLMPESYKFKHRKGLKNYIRTGKSRMVGRVVEVEGRRKDRSAFPVEIAVGEMHKDSQRKFVGILRDITERKQVEEVLLRSEALLNMSQSIAHIGCWELDLVANRLTWSDEVYRLFGLRLKEFDATYEAFLHTIHPDDRAAVEAAYSESLREGLDSYEIEHRIIRRDSGEIRIVYEKCTHVKDTSGRIVRSVGMVQDITERKQVEKKLKEYQENLKKLVERRTAELLKVNKQLKSEIIEHKNTEIALREHEEELKKHREHLEELVEERTAELAVAKEQAESADRLKSAFLASMSHELRTPLNSIIGFTSIVLQGMSGPLNDEQTKQLDMVHDSSHHLLNLINDILDVSKIEAGQLEVVFEPFDMREAIEKVVRTVTPLAEKKNLAIVFEIAPQVGRILSDRRRVEQIIINLLNNAVKFSEKGEVHVECQVDGGRLVTRVVDTGIGIKPEDMRKLFEAFQQIDNGLSRLYEGTGLGLSICKKLVEMLGGEIRAESEHGVGSTFTFTLPIKQAETTRTTGSR